MGREIKRVATDFDHPLGQVWPGYLNPVRFPQCPECGGDGYNPRSRQVAETFYAFGAPDSMRWSDKITQDEVDHLLSENRLRTWRDGRWHTDPVSAETVNEANRRGGGLGAYYHDGINRLILIRYRCDRMGIDIHCPTCEGNGDIATAAEREQRDGWEPTEPPAGTGWQVWETVSEGSPISPVFPTAAALIEHLTTAGTTWDKAPWRREAAEQFVKDEWAPTMVGVPGVGIFRGAQDADQIARAR